MKKTFFIFLLCLAACGNEKKIGPDEAEKRVCQENVDTTLAHIKGWKVIKSYFSTDLYYRFKDNQGQENKFYCYILYTDISDGIDTITILTEPFGADEQWRATILNPSTSLDCAEVIKRGNLAIKRLCSNDSCFKTSVYDNVLSVVFEKDKPKEIPHPKEDYGLTDDDF